jgi:hypothetical protein
MRLNIIAAAKPVSANRMMQKMIATFPAKIIDLNKRVCLRKTEVHKEILPCFS